MHWAVHWSWIVEGTSQGEKFKPHLAAKSEHEVLSNTAHKQCWRQREGRGGKAFPQLSALGAGVEHHFQPKGKTPNVLVLCFSGFPGGSFSAICLHSFSSS